MPPNVLTDLIDAETRRRILEDNEDLVTPLPGIVVGRASGQQGLGPDYPLRGGRRGRPPTGGGRRGRPPKPKPKPVATRPDLQPGERAPQPPEPGKDPVRGFIGDVGTVIQQGSAAIAQPIIGAAERVTETAEQMVTEGVSETFFGGRTFSDYWDFYRMPGSSDPMTGEERQEAFWGGEDRREFVSTYNQAVETATGVPHENIPMAPTIEDEMYYPMSVPAHRQEPFTLGGVNYPAYWNTGVYDETQRNFFGTLDKPFGPYPPGEEPPQITDIEDYDTRWSKYDVLLEMNGVNPEDPDEVNAFLQYVDPVTMLDMMNEGYIQEVEGLSEAPEGGTGGYGGYPTYGGGYNRGGYYSPGGYYRGYPSYRSSERDYPARVGLVSWRL